MHLHGAGRDLLLQRLIGAEQKLLAGLAAGVERARHLDAAERSRVEQAAVFARKGDALRHALIDDVHAQLRQAIHIRLARAEVASFDGVVEEAVDAVAVVAIVLGRVDSALRRDRMRAARAVMIRKAVNLVPLLSERSGRRRSGQTGADDDDREFAAIGGVHQLHFEAAVVPLLLDRSRWNSGVKHCRPHQCTSPVITASGTEMNPAKITIAMIREMTLSFASLRAVLQPRVWIKLQMPWSRCRHSAAIAMM